MKKLITQYLHSVNQPIEINNIQLAPGEFNRGKRFHPVLVKVKGNIYSNDRKNIIAVIDNSYNANFQRILYEYWLGHFSLVRNLPADSIIKSLTANNFHVNHEQIDILEIDSMNVEEKFFPVKVVLKKANSDSLYNLPFYQDEFGIWHIGISKLLTPESTVKEFLYEVNKGNTDKARRYFSYGYKEGYDDFDKQNLEQLFPKGTIKEIYVSDVISEKDTSTLNLTVVKTDLDTFKTNLEFIKLGIEWRFNYNGWDWKFKPTNFHRKIPH